MPDSASRAYRAFEAAGAILQGHFVYTSGRHGSQYLEKFRLLEDPRATTELGGMIARHFTALRPEVVAGPTLGGVILAYEVARQLGAKAIYLERGEAGGRVLRRGFAIGENRRVLLVDDVVTTGGSLAESTDCIRQAGGTVIGIGVLADRTAGRTSLGVPFFACATLDFASYAPQQCPLCASGVPLEAPRGSSQALLRR